MQIYCFSESRSTFLHLEEQVFIPSKTTIDYQYLILCDLFVNVGIGPRRQVFLRNND